MALHSKAMSTAVAAVGMIVLLVVGAGAGYYIGTTTSPGSAATTSVSGSTVTVTVTNTVTGSASSGPNTQGIDQALAASCQSSGGQATIYTTEDQNIWNPYSYPMLHQIFPWFTVNFVGLGSGDVVTKGTAEYQGGHVTADVFGAPVANILRLVRAGAVQSWNNSAETALGYSSSFRDPSGYYHPMWQNPILALYNTNLVKDLSTLPKNWTDLANPVWKGKIAMNNPSTLSTDALLFATLEPQMGNASWTQFMANLKANSPALTSDAGGAYTDVSTGQAAIGIGLFNDYYVGATKTNAPVHLINMTGPIYVSSSVLGLAKNSPHQACGQLLIQYLESNVGQMSFGEGGTVPVLNPEVNAPTIFKVLPANPNFVSGGYNQPTFFSNGPMWANLYASIFGQ